MLRKRCVIWETCLLVFGVLFAFYLMGCNHRIDSGEVNEAENEKQKMKEKKIEEKVVEEIVEICLESYTKAEKEDRLDDLEMIRELLDKLGKNGYTAVDSENQMNMTEHEKLLQFCEAVEAKKRSHMTVVEVSGKGSCIIREMETKNGDVKLIRNYYVYGDEKMELSSKDTYHAESWEYTEDGYLMFSGWLTLKDSYEITRDKMMEYTAYRVLPLDETCRELNRKYLLPVGYACNNMFLEDWSEEDFGKLDFYDLFDVFHPQSVNESVYDTSDNGMKTCAVYMIPKEDFERSIMSKFKISSEMLQSKTVYDSEEERYEYKPRGLEEVEYPEYPYPEVTAYEENADGTLTLKVNAVFPYRGISKAYTHEVTVRDMGDGEIHYVANRVVEPVGNQEIAWHKPRLTRAEWEAQYGGK